MLLNFLIWFPSSFLNSWLNLNTIFTEKLSSLNLKILVAFNLIELNSTIFMKQLIAWALTYQHFFRIIDCFFAKLAHRQFSLLGCRIIIWRIILHRREFLFIITSLLIAWTLTARRIRRFIRALISCCYSQKLFTVVRATVTPCKRCLEKVELIIKCKFFILLNVFDTEYTNRNFIQYWPLTGLAVWIAWMVNKSSYISWYSRVNNFVVINSHQICAGWVFVIIYSFPS